MTRFAAALLAALVCGGGSRAGDDHRLAAPDGRAEVIHVQDNSDSRSHTTDPALPAGCFKGRLTAEGDTCQAMRTAAGELITLGGPLRGFRDGDAVCVCGVRAKEPFCRQGVTVIIREIAATCATIR